MRRHTLIGTGIVVSATSIITCRHGLDALRQLHPDRGERFARAGVLCSTIPCRSIGARASADLDLCLLKFSELPGAKPAMFMRVGRLENKRIAAIGFKPRSLDVRVLPELRVLQEEQSRDRLQSVQFAGGAPAGFSGAPILAESEGGWRTVGMLCLGGDESATSRMIATDPIAEFLAGEGIELSIDDSVPLMDAEAREGKATVRVGRNVEDSAIDVTGQQSFLDVGHSIRGSAVRVRSTTRGKA